MKREEYAFAYNINGTGMSGIITMTNPPNLVCYCDTGVILPSYLHAQRLAGKMVEEKLREELMRFDQWATKEVYIGSSPNTQGSYDIIDQYLKSRER